MDSEEDSLELYRESINYLFPQIIDSDDSSLNDSIGNIDSDDENVWRPYTGIYDSSDDEGINNDNFDIFSLKYG